MPASRPPTPSVPAGPEAAPARRREGHTVFPAVDVLRGIAALLVLGYHVVEIGKWASFPVTGPALLVRVGWIGVDMFFVISGFVIGLSTL